MTTSNPPRYPRQRIMDSCAVASLPWPSLSSCSLFQSCFPVMSFALVRQIPINPTLCKGIAPQMNIHLLLVAALHWSFQALQCNFVSSSIDIDLVSLLSCRKDVAHDETLYETIVPFLIVMNSDHDEFWCTRRWATVWRRRRLQT